MWVMDAWRVGEALAVWVKTRTGDERRVLPGRAVFTVQESIDARRALDRLQALYVSERRRTIRAVVDVLKVTVRLDQFERVVRAFERETCHRVPVFDADISPEQRFFFDRAMYPGCPVDAALCPAPGDAPVLRVAEVEVVFSAHRVVRITLDHQDFTGEERSLCRSFVAAFMQRDPDVVVMDDAFSVLPLLASRIASFGIACPWHRWDAARLEYRGGRTFYSYGRVAYRDFAVRLRGRFLVSRSTPIGRTCDADAILELCRLSSWQFQQLASRSHGAVFQAALLRELVYDKILVPYKEKPLPEPVPLDVLVKNDRAGHTLDAQVGFHTDVAEVDFASLFPHLMVQRNISAERVGTGEQAPGVPVRIDTESAGYVPRALLPFLERRMWYKRNPSVVNRRRSAGLKGVLVSANGYLRFREFKLGLPATHVALCAYAREILLETVHEAERRGFRVVHGIVDSLYLHKPSISEKEVRAFCRDVSRDTGIPLVLAGMFRWMVFLPSVQDAARPVPTRFYGAFRSGGFKVRGVESRQQRPPRFVRRFQEAVLHVFSQQDTEADLLATVPSVFRAGARVLASLHTLPADMLAFTVCLGRATYQKDIPQRRVVQTRTRLGLSSLPGQTVQYVLTCRGVVLPEAYAGNPDVRAYRKELARCLRSLLCVFGVTQAESEAALSLVRQETLLSFSGARVDNAVVYSIVAETLMIQHNI